MYPEWHRVCKKSKDSDTCFFTASKVENPNWLSCMEISGTGLSIKKLQFFVILLENSSQR